MSLLWKCLVCAWHKVVNGQQRSAAIVFGYCDFILAPCEMLLKKNFYYLLEAETKAHCESCRSCSHTRVCSFPNVGSICSQLLSPVWMLSKWYLLKISLCLQSMHFISLACNLLLCLYFPKRSLCSVHHPFQLPPGLSSNNLTIFL